MIQKFYVGGMTCSACSQGIEKNISSLNGVNSATVSLMSKELIVDFDDAVISSKDIIAIVEKLGYSADFYSEDKIDKNFEAKKLKKRFFISLFFLIPLLYFSMGAMIGLPVFGKKINFILQWVFASLIIAINFKFYVNGVKAVLHKSPNMDTLVTLGSFSAYCYSIVAMVSLFFGKTVEHTFFEASAMVLALVTLGKWLEERSKVKTGDAIDKLNKLMPKTATILKDGKMITVLTSEIEVGDTVIVRAGEYVTIDGVVVEGYASIDKSAITGESIPEEVKVDDFVGSGCIIKEGFLMVEAIQVGGDTMFSKIVEIVKSAGASKAPIQKLADRISSVFVPIVTLLAIITFTLWAVLTGDVYKAFNFGICVLVISCPCSLGLATPVAIMASAGRSASVGVLYKDAMAIQNACKINCVLLDKTATITVGEPKVLDFKNFSKISEEYLLNIACAIEDKSSHPLAKAICDFCGETKVEVNNYQYFMGKGATAEFEGKTYYIGNASLIPKDIDVFRQTTEQEYLGKTIIYFADQCELLAIFAIADYVKEDSKNAIEKLKGFGAKIVMVTGDNKTVAESVAKEVGIENIEAQVLPEQKYKIVEKYKKEGLFVAMVGDGINDSPALKSADIGVAMGNGTDIAIDSSDIVLANGSLNGLVSAMEISKKTLKIIKQNLFWAFFYNVITIPVAAGLLSFFGVVLTPVIASASMSLSSLIVVTNALRLSRVNKTKKIKKPKAKINFSYQINIEGMMCMHCSSKVKEALEKIEGVLKVEVDLKNKKAIVGASTMIAEKEFQEKILTLGYGFQGVKPI